MDRIQLRGAQRVLRWAALQAWEPCWGVLLIVLLRIEAQNRLCGPSLLGVRVSSGGGLIVEVFIFYFKKIIFSIPFIVER